VAPSPLTPEKLEVGQMMACHVAREARMKEARMITYHWRVALLTPLWVAQGFWRRPAALVKLSAKSP